MKLANHISFFLQVNTFHNYWNSLEGQDMLNHMIPVEMKTNLPEEFADLINSHPINFLNLQFHFWEMLKQLGWFGKFSEDCPVCIFIGFLVDPRMDYVIEKVS